MRIGLSSCPVRMYRESNRCYRCHEEGHFRGACKGPDLSGCCWKCKNQGHLAKDCKEPEVVDLEVDADGDEAEKVTKQDA